MNRGPHGGSRRLALLLVLSACGPVPRETSSSSSSSGEASSSSSDTLPSSRAGATSRSPASSAATPSSRGGSSGTSSVASSSLSQLASSSSLAASLQGSSSSAVSAPPPVFLAPRPALTATELGVLVNDDDPQSVDVAAYYIEARGIPAANVVHLHVPPGDSLTPDQFTPLAADVDAALSPSVQALAITWSRPWKVGCMSITSAFGLGYDPAWCIVYSGMCRPTRTAATYDSNSPTPFTTHHIRPAMMLAGENTANVLALIDRGVAADTSFPAGGAYLVRTTDSARSNARHATFSSLAQSWPTATGITVHYTDNSTGTASDVVANSPDVLFYLTGLTSVAMLDSNTYLPGAVADHLTSYGGVLFGATGQMSSLRWLEAGATASFGTVVEPCAFPQKFPDASILLRRYFHGETLLEAYFKSVSMPGEGIFIGEPLARPWGWTSSFANNTLTITTSAMVPGRGYTVEAAASETGPFIVITAPTSVPGEQVTHLTVENPVMPYYRVTP